MDKVRVVILGTGAMAAQHVRLFRDDPRVDIVGCVDIDASRAQEFSKTFGIAQHFGKLDEAIRNCRFDAASNVTPDQAHHATTLKLLEACKHVLCEKPLAENFAQADEMARLAEAKGLVNMVNLSYRNVAALQKARAMIESGEIGELRHLEASYRQSWLVGNHWGDWQTDPKWLWRLSEKHGSKGVLGDVGIHILDFATYAVGMLPNSLQARLKTFDKAPKGKIGDYVLDANDSAVMSVSFPNGALGVIHTSRFMTGYGNVLRLQAFGTKGAIEIDHGLDWTEIRCCSGADVHSLAWRRIVSEPVKTIHHHFISAITSAAADGPSFRRGADLQKILDLCFEPGEHSISAVS